MNTRPGNQKLKLAYHSLRISSTTPPKTKLTITIIHNHNTFAIHKHKTSKLKTSPSIIVEDRTRAQQQRSQLKHARAQNSSVPALSIVRAQLIAHTISHPTTSPIPLPIKSVLAHEHHIVQKLHYIEITSGQQVLKYFVRPHPSSPQMAPRDW